MSRTPNLEDRDQNFCETRFKTWTGLSCNSFCVFHSVIGIACLALHLLCLLCIVKQGHRPRTVKASTLGITVMGIICLQSNFWTQKPKLGPAWCLQDFVGHCMVPFHPVLVCSLATLKCSPESWLWPDCRRSHGFDLWHGR